MPLSLALAESARWSETFSLKILYNREGLAIAPVWDSTIEGQKKIMFLPHKEGSIFLSTCVQKVVTNLGDSSIR